MKTQLEKFLKKSEAKAFNKQHRKILNFNIGKYNDSVIEGKKQYEDLETAREQAKNIKWQALENLDNYLLEFERNFKKNGGEVIWAETGDEAVQAVLDIAQENAAKSIVKSKSMVTEEIHLNTHLEHNGLVVFETDLGEYIVQLENEKPYHIVAPAIHKSKEDVAELFHKEFGTPKDATPQFLTAVARQNLREQYTRADIGITGGNFLIADTGSVGVTENEGNARLSTTFPKIHIAIVGIEKMIPSINNLDLFLPLLATYGTGQNVTVYNSIFNGPRKENEANGPEKMYVILLDNGRTNILAKPNKRQSLYCIRCGACLNACPVYKNIGGHTYDTTYSGPIGSVISPHLKGMEKYGHLSDASPMCGNCSASCPVKIDIHEMLLTNRHDKIKSGQIDKGDPFMWKMWRRGMTSRMLMNTPKSLKNFTFQYVFKETWGKRRELPKFPAKSFNQLWKKGIK